jgi:serralysin
MPNFEHSPFPHGFPLFPSEGFERWQYGPDNRPVYYQFECGGDCFLLVDIWGDGPLPLPDQIINWEYDETGRVTRELVDEDGDGRAERVTFYEFNDAGNITRELVDTSGDGSPNEAAFYRYDASGRLLRRYVDENGNGTIDAADATEYDSRGNVTAQYSEHYNLGTVENGSSFNHYYDEDGNRTRKETDRDANGTIDEIEEWNYDAGGILLSRRVEVLDANPPGSVETWLYDSRGNVTRREYDDDGNGVPEQRTTYDYDAHGNLLREANGYSFDGDGVMEETELREYVPTGWGHILSGELSSR